MREETGDNRRSEEEVKRYHMVSFSLAAPFSLYLVLLSDEVQCYTSSINYLECYRHIPNLYGQR